MVGTLADRRTSPRRLQIPARHRLARALETAAVLLAPVVLYFVLQLRGMAPVVLPDPSMHTTFIVDPHDIFARYQGVFTPTARLREAARVGFLVPARLSYLLFGTLPGFFVWRYLLALITVVPAYLLGRRLYGRWAGWLAIVVLMSSPVLVTAWGTDYPDSAAVSYLTGGLALLALCWQAERRRPALHLLGGGLLTLAVWSHGIAVPLAAVAVVVYVGLRAVRDRPGLILHLALLAGSALCVTLVLAVASKLLIGPFDFITPTIRAEEFLSTPAQEALWHSSSWRWAPYDAYLLVPPATLVAFLAVFARWRPRVPSAQLFLGLTAALQLLLLSYLQFFGHVQGLEMHYLSSTLWASVNLVLWLVLAELARPAALSRPSCAAPVVLVLAVAIGYGVAQPRVPAMTWAPWGAVVALVLILAAIVGRQALRSARIVRGREHGLGHTLGVGLVSALAVGLVTVASLVLTVAPEQAHAHLARTISDPPPAYATALGGDQSWYVDQYVVASELPAFVGPPAYRGEQLLTWWPWYDATPVVEPMGIYHSAFNAVSWTFPNLGSLGVAKIESRHAAQVLMMNLDGRHFQKAVASMARFRPVVVRRGVLTHGRYHLHVWLVDLLRYLHRPSARRSTSPPARSSGIGSG